MDLCYVNYVCILMQDRNQQTARIPQVDFSPWSCTCMTKNIFKIIDYSKCDSSSIFK